MTTVTTKKGYSVLWNGNNFWAITDCTGTCIGHFDSLRKANNKLEKILSYQA